VSGGDLDQLVVPDELQGLFQGHLSGSIQTHGLLGGGGAHVGDVLLLADVDIQVIGPTVLANDHSGVDLFARLDEEDAAVLQVGQGVGRRRS